MSILLSCRLDLNGVIPVPEVVSELGIVLQPSYGLIRREYGADLAGGNDANRTLAWANARRTSGWHRTLTSCVRSTPVSYTHLTLPTTPYV